MMIFLSANFKANGRTVLFGFIDDGAVHLMGEPKKYELLFP
jgi:hypothetical protein